MQVRVNECRTVAKPFVNECETGQGGHHEWSAGQFRPLRANGEWCTATATSGRGCGGWRRRGGIVGGVTGAAKRHSEGLSSGSKSTRGSRVGHRCDRCVAGLVDWPILLARSGRRALLLRKLSHTPRWPPPVKAKLAPVPDKPAAAKRQPKLEADNSRKTSGRRAGTAELRSTN